MNRRMNAATVYFLYEGGFSFLTRLTFTIYSVFAIVRLGLDPFQLVLLGTILEGTYLLFELPTGVLADTFGRRLSVIIGVFGSGLAFLTLGLSTTFWMAALSQVLWGVFATFTSGADVAWLTDEIGEKPARRAYLRAEQVGHLAALAGIAVSVALASIALTLPIVVTGGGLILMGVVLIVVMPEERFRKRDRAVDEGAFVGMVRTLKEGVAQVRAHHVLLLIIATAALHGASTEGFDRLSDFHLLQDIGLPAIGHLDRVVWFGILDGIGLVVGLTAITYVRRRHHLEGHAVVARILAAIDVLLVLSVVAFGITSSFWLAIMAFWVVAGLRSVREPIFIAWINQGLDPGTRATINSMGTQADAVGQAAGGPVLGLIGNASVPWALVTSGLLRLPALFLYVVAIRRGTVGTVAPDEMDEELTLAEED
jgi:MFS transporter, DHA3 family, tetracycline resistance protein